MLKPCWNMLKHAEPPEELEINHHVWYFQHGFNLFKWGLISPKWGLPLDIIHFHRDVPWNKPSSYWVPQWLCKPPYKWFLTPVASQILSGIWAASSLHRYIYHLIIIYCNPIPRSDETPPKWSRCGKSLLSTMGSFRWRKQNLGGIILILTEVSLINHLFQGSSIYGNPMKR